MAELLRWVKEINSYDLLAAAYIFDLPEEFIKKRLGHLTGWDDEVLQEVS